MPSKCDGRSVIALKIVIVGGSKGVKNNYILLNYLTVLVHT